MAKKRPIDRIRESGGRFQLSAADDNTGISDLFTIGDKLHILTERGLYEFRFADAIDPERTNPNLPPVQRRVLSAGSGDIYVARVLLTARQLFSGKELAHVINPQLALQLAFDCVKDLIALREMTSEFAKAEKRAEKASKKQRKNTGALGLPSIPDIDARVDAMTQKANHAMASLKEIIMLFYSGKIKKKWAESFYSLIRDKFGNDSPFAKFLERATEVFLFIMNTRNGIEHRRAAAEVRIFDYDIDKDGKIWKPSIEVVHDRTPQPRVSIVDLMQQLGDALSEIAEVLKAYLASAHVQPVNGVHFTVAEIPETKRRHPTVRFGYAVFMGDEIIPFSQG